MQRKCVPFDTSTFSVHMLHLSVLVNTCLDIAETVQYVHASALCFSIFITLQEMSDLICLGHGWTFGAHAFY